MTENIKQVVVVEALRQEIFQELLLWGQAQWWPKSSLMKIDNLSGQINEETLYLQKVNLPFGPKWHTKNDQIDRDNFYIKRSFIDSFICGFEELLVEQQGKQMQVVYNLDYKIKGIFNKIIWQLVSKRLHIKNIDLILKTLKEHLEKK